MPGLGPKMALAESTKHVGLQKHSWSGSELLETASKWGKSKEPLPEMGTATDNPKHKFSVCHIKRALHSTTQGGGNMRSLETPS